MKLFGLEPIDQKEKPLQKLTESSIKLDAMDLGWLKDSFRPVEKMVGPEELKEKLHSAILEASEWFSTKIEGIAAGVSVDTVSVELGITVGGEIGFFAKGRADVAASFTVTLKVNK